MEVEARAECHTTVAVKTLHRVSRSSQTPMAPNLHEVGESADTSSSQLLQVGSEEIEC